jgi:mono/diheme cytochrome c family protein
MRTLIVLVEIAAGAVAAGAVFLFLGLYDVSATQQHLAPTFHLLQTGLRESVKHHSSGITVPPLDDPALAARGLAHFRSHCVQCHGAPGVAPQPFALGLRPQPASLVHTAREWSAAEIFWTVKHGIKMTGMPAWRFRMDDEDIWAIVAFVAKLPGYSPEEYRALRAPAPEKQRAAPAGAPDPERGRLAITQYACTTCHAIPGVVGPDAPVGPPLQRIGTRKFISGGLPNTPENMARWLRAPQEVNPDSAMPDLGVSERDAIDMAAYLETLR